VKLFISWSGRRSQTLAEFLKDWFEQVIPNGVDVFVSSQNIQKGGRGLNTIAQELESGDYGVVIVTAETQHSPWISFEAGALSKSITGAHVAPLLIDLAESDVTGPLAQFQMTRANDRGDVRKLVADMNIATGQPLPERSLNVLFDNTWASFATAVDAAQTPAEDAPQERSERDMVAELLDHVRDLRRDVSSNFASERARAKRVEKQEAELADELSFWISGRTRIRFTQSVNGDIFAAEVTVDEVEGVPTDEPDGEELQRIADEWDVSITIYSGGRIYRISPEVESTRPLSKAERVAKLRKVRSS